MTLAIGARQILSVVAIGIGATFALDLWNFFLKHVFRVSSLSYCLLGRWLRHMPTGRFRHASIAAAERKSHECAAGWLAHYTIGIGFALGFVALATTAWLAQPTILPALLFGLGTVIFPFFVMQPSFGLGIAASRTPSPSKARLKSLGTHAIFGLGLYASAYGLYLVRPLFE